MHLNQLLAIAIVRSFAPFVAAAAAAAAVVATAMNGQIRGEDAVAAEAATAMNGQIRGDDAVEVRPLSYDRLVQHSNRSRYRMCIFLHVFTHVSARLQVNVQQPATIDAAMLPASFRVAFRGACDVALQRYPETNHPAVLFLLPHVPADDNERRRCSRSDTTTLNNPTRYRRLAKPILSRK